MTVASVKDLPVEHQCCARCTYWGVYVRELANRMRLRDWMLEIEHEPHDVPGALAVVRIPEGRKVANVALHRDWEEFLEEEQTHALVHELVHPLLHHLHESVRKGALEGFGGAAYRVFMGSVDLELERATDVIAAVIAPSMPSPPTGPVSTLNP